MKITTLGTSHGDHTYCRFNSSTLFEIGDALYLVDAGAPVNGLLIRAGYDMRQIKAVLITHMHDDHVGGLPGLIKSLIKYPMDTQHTHIYLPEANVVPALLGWLAVQHLVPPEKLITFHEGDTGEINDGTVSVRRIGTRHLERPGEPPITFAYALRAEGKKVLCTGDLRPDFADFPPDALNEDFDLCFCEATHYDPKSALPVLKNCRIKRLVFNHVHNPWHGEGEQTLLRFYASLPYSVQVAHDGDEFIL